MNTQRHITAFAATIALTFVGALASAQDVAVRSTAPLATSHDMQLRGGTAMNLVVQPGAQDGHVAGHPGRVAVLVEDGDWVFRVGGDKPIADIYRDVAEVRVPIRGMSRATIRAEYHADGGLVLMVDDIHGRRVESGMADVAVMEQLDMLESMVGGVICSDRVFVGASAAPCGTAFDGVVETFEVATLSERPTNPVGC